MTDAAGLTRRELLARTGWLAAGTTVVVGCGAWLPVLPSRSMPSAEGACVWVQALPDGRVRLLCPRAEMGQGVATGCAQIVAEELRLPRHRLDVVFPNSGQIEPVIMTVGSWSILEFFEPLARGAAALRETLRARAAERAGVAPADVRWIDGGFLLPDGMRVGYGALVPEGGELIEADAAFANGDVPLRSALRDQLEHVGQPWRPVGIEAIVTGAETYSRDVAPPGMVFGAVAHPPRLGARLVGADVAAARRAPDVIEAALELESGRAGVICRTPFALPAALEALAPVWEGGATSDQAELDRELDVERALEAEALEHTLSEEGDVEYGAARAVTRLRARYASPFLAHAAMEPRSGVVALRRDGVEAWTASQDLWLVQGRVARITGRDRDDVVVHAQRLGGAFGGRSVCQATEEAAWLATFTDHPVRVQWSREDEFRHNYFMPTFSHAIEAGVGEDGRITDWRHDFVSQPIVFTSMLLPERWHWLLDIPSDPGTGRNALPPYWLPHRRIRYSDVRTPVPTGAWRGLGAAPNAFAVESAMDELAHLAGADPLQFRLDHLGAEHEGLARVLRRAARMAGWGRKLRRGRGLGIAGAVYKDATFVGLVAEVTVDRSAGSIRVERVFCAHDCGLVINPDQVRAQIEGNVAFGCSMTLRERASLSGGAMAAANFDAYPILRQSEMPDVEIELLGDPDARPVGAGEPSIAPVPAAIANAVFAATGERLRTLPLALPSA